MPVTVLAVDLGSSSGRVVAGTYREGRIDEVEVRRFPHRARHVDGYLSWDLDFIRDEVVAGLRDAVAMFPDAVSVSVDTWGVDYVPLDGDGRPVTPGRCYRDDRTTRTLGLYRARLDDEAAWAATGIAPAVINSSNQLFAYLAEEPEAAARTERVLFLADYFTYLLSGVAGWSRSPASTSGLCAPGADAFSAGVLGALGIPASWFGTVSREHTVVGPCVVDGLGQLTVVRAGGHDTACAVHALQRDADRDAYFLSCGSWSVLGVLRDEPLLSPEARELGISNEARADAGLRPLFNLTGLWILQECQRQWQEEGGPDDIVELLRLAEASPSPGVVIDTDDPRFAVPDAMVDRVREVVAEAGIPPSSLDAGAVFRVVLESLAARYAEGVAALDALTGARVPQLNLVGGGSRNALLCQLTADAIGKPVVAGPVEASVLGSLLAQLEVMGHLAPVDRNSVIGATASTVRYDPAR